MRRRSRSSCIVVEMLWLAVFVFGLLIAGAR